MTVTMLIVQFSRNHQDICRKPRSFQLSVREFPSKENTFPAEVIFLPIAVQRETRSHHCQLFVKVAQVISI